MYEYIIHYSTGSSVSFFRLSGSLNCTLLKAPTIIKKINLNLQEKKHTVTVGVYNILYMRRTGRYLGGDSEDFWDSVPH